MKKVSNPDLQEITLFGHIIPARGFLVISDEEAAQLHSVCPTLSVTHHQESDATPTAEEHPADAPVQAPKKKGRPKKAKAVEVPPVEPPAAQP